MKYWRDLSTLHDLDYVKNLSQFYEDDLIAGTSIWIAYPFRMRTFGRRK
jgi:hypothetical protein